MNSINSYNSNKKKFIEFGPVVTKISLLKVERKSCIVCFDRRFDFFQTLSKDISATTKPNSMNFFLFEFYKPIEFKRKRFVGFGLVVIKISLLKV